MTNKGHRQMGENDATKPTQQADNPPPQYDHSFANIDNAESLAQPSRPEDEGREGIPRTRDLPSLLVSSDAGDSGTTAFLSFAAAGHVIREPRGHGLSAFLLMDKKKHLVGGLLISEALFLLKFRLAIDSQARATGDIARLAVAQYDRARWLFGCS